MLAAPVSWLILAAAGLSVNTHSPDIKLLFWSALIYPILEEIVFRGTLQPALLSRAWFRHSKGGISLANVLTSIVFAGFHLISQAPLWASLVFLPSLVFGATRDRYGNISASIVLHMFYNFGFIILFAR